MAGPDQTARDVMFEDDADELTSTSPPLPHPDSTMSSGPLPNTSSTSVVSARPPPLPAAPLGFLPHAGSTHAGFASSGSLPSSVGASEDGLPPPPRPIALRRSSLRPTTYARPSIAAVSQARLQPQQQRRATISGSAILFYRDRAAGNDPRRQSHMSSQSTLRNVFQTALETVLESSVVVSAVAVVFALSCSALIGILFVLFGAELAGISLYNLTHLVIALLGKSVISSGILLAVITAKAVVANTMVASSQGVALTEAVVKPGYHSPARGWTMRCLFFLSLCAVELSLWVLEYEMEWIKTESSPLGTFDCNPATYPVAPTPKPDLLNYLDGDVEFSSIYSYGLPLLDGIVGGWAAWPLAGPAPKFTVEGSGVVYLISAQCSAPVPASEPLASPPSGSAPTATIALTRADTWGTVAQIGLNLTLAAFQHDVAEFADRDVALDCLVEVMVGPGTVQFQFVMDEWYMVSGGRIVEIQLADAYAADRTSTDLAVLASVPYATGGTLTISQGLGTDPLAGMYAAQVRERLAPVAAPYANVTSWIAAQLTAAMASEPLSCTSTRSTSLCSAIEWAADSGSDGDERFVTAHAARGVAGLVGEFAHYVTNQYDGSTVASCAYWGDTGRGVVLLPASTHLLVVFSLSLTGLLAVWQVAAFWLVGGGTSPTASLAAQVLDDPVVLLFYIRNNVGHLVPSRMPASDAWRSRRAMVDFLNGVRVRFGECKAARGSSTRVLTIDVPASVLKMRALEED
ncbi:hypothetical protein HK405_002847 [Cladochytrium tenue]|nr:hypothetical protein HK405_002847 [Cladochytrium tenue]